MDKTNLRFDWIGKTTIQKHWDDLTKDELLMYVDWLENKLVKNCSIPNAVGRSEQLKAFAQFLYEKEYLVRRSVNDALKEFNGTEAVRYIENLKQK